MRNVRLALSLLFSVLVFSSASAQISKLDAANAEFQNEGYHEAAELYKQAYEKLNKKGDRVALGRALYRIGECYRLMTDDAAAVEWYSKAVTARYHKEDPDVYFNWGESLRELEKFDEAVEQYNKYIAEGGDKALAQGRIEECKEASNQLIEPKARYIVENETQLNSPNFDFSPTFSEKKEDEIVFSSSRASAYGSGVDPKTGENFMDLFSAKRDKKGKWSTPVPLNNVINTASNEGASCFDDGKKDMYFTRCVYEDNDRFGCDIYVSQKSGTNYRGAELVSFIDREMNDSTNFGHPFLTKDDKYLLFASDLFGGFGGKDLWYSEYDKKAKTWGAPVNLGPQINTEGDEMFPFIHEDGSLYFSSTSHDNLGGLDIFKAASAGELKWNNPTNMQYPINSSSDDFGVIFEGGKDQGLFTSNRPGGKGKDDIYSFKMPPLEFCLQAIVYDEETAVPISDAKVVITGSDGSSVEMTSDGNGGISLCDGQILAETNYTVDVSKTGYIGTGDQFSTIGLSESTTFAREYFIQEIVIGTKTYDLPLVLYPFNSADLLVDAEVNSKDSLNYLYDIMVNNPTLVIQLEAHTDTRGTDSGNQKLSQRRAETCVNYLVSKGVDKARMTPKGLGESAPLITDKQINAMKTEEEKEAAHQVNRRTVFKILSYDYVPPGQN